MTDPRSIEAALAKAGWGADAETLVAGWFEHRQDELEWEETWEPDDRCRYLSACPAGERFVVEWVAGDTWELSITWPDGWGREHVRMGFLEDLRDAAAELRETDGPFGGPQAGPYTQGSCQALPACALPDQRGQRLAGDVELRFELLRDELAAIFFIARGGSLNNLWIFRLAPGQLPDAIEALQRMPRFDPTLWVHAKGKRRAWLFTGRRPMLARMPLDGRELLLTCPDASTAIILAHDAGRLETAVQFGMDELANFDAGSWLASAPPWPGSRRAPRVVEPPDISSTPTDATDRESLMLGAEPPAEPATSTESPEIPATKPAPSDSDAVAEAAPAPASPTTSLAPPTQVDAAARTPSETDSTSFTASVTNAELPGDNAAGKDAPLPDEPEPASQASRSLVPPAGSPSPSPSSQPPQESAADSRKQVSPRFPLAAAASAEDLQRHFSEVEAAIPPRKIGAATAVELWQAIRETHHQGLLPITGNWVDLVALLHHRGFLAHLPSDRASRAALVILAELSPLVRRLHHRRWVLGAEH